MKPQIHLAISLGVIFFLSAGCEKLFDSSDNTYENENLLQAEEAFPNTSGEIVDIGYKGENLTCELIDGKYVFQGDMIINPDGNKRNLKGAGLDDDYMKWPYGRVYYTISDDILDPERITEAIEHWESRTDIQFLERTDEDDYIHFIKSGGCWSYVGMQGGRQELGVGNWGEKGNMIHEIGHALGVYHEHSRFNRDESIIVNWDNILPEKIHNFDLYNDGIATQELDFNSIMIYPSKAFQKGPGLPTLTKLDGSTFVAQREELSVLDADIISWMYNEIHDPDFEYLISDEQTNVGIASDGEFYYTISMDQSGIRKLSLDGSPQILHATYSLPLIRARGLAYNKSDGKLYVSALGGDIIRITDLENGQIETVYQNIMQNKEASFALSEDGSKMYDFYKGTLKVYDFLTGELAYTLNGLKYGDYLYHDDEYSDAYAGAASVAVDASYIYTCNSYFRPCKVYVYNHLGEFQREMELETGENGISLSVIDGYIFIAWDDTYDPGSWWKYNIRNPIE